MGDCLTDEHAVEWIAVELEQLKCDLLVQRKTHDTEFLAPHRYERSRWFGLGETAISQQETELKNTSLPVSE